MKLALAPALLLATATCAFAQEPPKDVFFQTAVAAPGQVALGGVMKGPLTPVKGAPFSATITNESVQTLADGNRIVQTSSGNTARDSQGRTRQDFALPAIGNLSAAEAPRLVFIHDPVAQTSYTLNLAEKTAQKLPMPPLPAALPSGTGGGAPEAGASFSVSAAGPGLGPDSARPDAGPEHVISGAAVGPVDGSVSTMAFHKLIAEGQGQATTEDLGTQTMEGIIVTGVRTTRTIPAGAIGNDKPVVIVTEVWTSPDLKTIVSSKRSDPRMGEQTFKLTNLVRAEPDASLFTVPPDFKVADGPQHVIYRSNR